MLAGCCSDLVMGSRILTQTARQRRSMSECSLLMQYSTFMLKIVLKGVEEYPRSGRLSRIKHSPQSSQITSHNLYLRSIDYIINSIQNEHCSACISPLCGRNGPTADGSCTILLYVDETQGKNIHARCFHHGDGCYCYWRLVCSKSS